MPNFSDANRVAVRYIKEATWGTTPTGPAMTELPITSESFKSDITTVTSDTIRSDRNVADRVKVGGGASGDVGFELRYGDWDAFLEGALQSSFATTVFSATLASAYVSGAKLHCTGSVMNSVVSGQFLRIANASNTANNGDYRVTYVSTVNASTRSLVMADASSGASAAFTGEVLNAANTTVKGKMMRNGVTPTSFTIEKEFADVSAFHQFAGMRVGTMAMNLEQQSILTGNFGFIGKSQVATSVTLASTTASPTTNPVMNASGNVVRIWEGSEAVTGAYFQSISIELNNNPREQAVVGSDSLAGVATGRCEIGGSFSAYFEDNTTLDKFVNATDTSFRFQINDNDGNSYIISIPAVRLEEADIVAGGANTDVLQNFSWGAFINGPGTHSIQIDVLDA